MSVYKLYTKEVRDKKDYVYLYLYKLNTGERQPELKSLKMRIPKKYCIYNDKSFNRISQSLPTSYLDKYRFSSVDSLNQYLNIQLSQFIKSNGYIPVLPDDKKTLNDWFSNLIERQLNQGTKMRYKNVLNLIKQFQLYYSKTIEKKDEPNDKIYFRKINVDYLLDFRRWLLSEPTNNEHRKKNTINSANHKLKCVKSILNQAHGEGYFNFHIKPFDHIKFRFKENKVEILTLEELKRLIETEYTEVLRRTKLTNDGKSLFGKEIIDGVEERNKRNKRYKAKHTLNDIRNYFVFQLLCQGIRISDLITLRWSNFIYKDKTLRIDKTMVKTGKQISVLVNDKMSSILSGYLYRYKSIFPDLISDLEMINDNIKYQYSLVNSKKSFISMEDIYYDNFYFINKEVVKYQGKIGVLIDENDINELESFLEEKRLENTLHHYINNNVEYRRNQIPYVKLSLYITELRKWHNENMRVSRDLFVSNYEVLRRKRHLMVASIIQGLISIDKVKNEFVFTLLNTNDFLGVGEDGWNLLTENQYRKFQSARSYYNKLLKIVGVQAKIDKRLTTHIARHSYTSLMLELGENVNLFDLMTSLGHTHLSTTQSYIQRISTKRVDNINLVISDTLDEGLTTINI
jgi:integrase